MELWHLGQCLLCLVIGAVIGVIVDIESSDKAENRAYHMGYKEGKDHA
jgi:hypothetical protein